VSKFIATHVADEVGVALREQATREARSLSFVVRRALIRDLRRRGHHHLVDPTSTSPISESGSEAETPSLTKVTEDGGHDRIYRT